MILKKLCQLLLKLFRKIKEALLPILSVVDNLNGPLMQKNTKNSLILLLFTMIIKIIRK